MKSKKSVLFLVILIVLLYMSQYVFPDPPAKENSTMSPEQIEESVSDPKEQGPTHDVKDVIPDQ